MANIKDFFRWCSSQGVAIPCFILWFILIISSNRKNYFGVINAGKNICYIHMPTVNKKNSKYTNHFITLQVLWWQKAIFEHRHHVFFNVMVHPKTKKISSSHSNVTIFTFIPMNWTTASIILLYFEIVQSAAVTSQKYYTTHITCHSWSAFVRNYCALCTMNYTNCGVWNTIMIGVIIL